MGGYIVDEESRIEPQGEWSEIHNGYEDYNF